MIRSLSAGAIKLLCGCSARWSTPLEGDGPWLFCPNHTSHLDSVAVWAALPTHCRNRCRIAAAQDYWGRSAIHRWIACEGFRAVLINRKNITKQNYPVRIIADVLKQGESAIFFPEGTRHAEAEPTRTLGPFRPGLWHIAHSVPGLQIVPVWIDNLSRVLPKGECVPVPFAVGVHFGEPFQLAEGMNKSEFLTHAATKVESLAKQC